MEKKPLENQPFKGKYVKESFPLPKERTFEEWVRDLEAINATNIKETHCVMVTAIQWNELKGIIRKDTVAAHMDGFVKGRDGKNL